MATSKLHADGTRREWAPRGHERADFIEVTLKGTNDSRDVYKGHLENAEIADWIDASRKYPAHTGGLQLLVCDRHRYDFELPIAKGTFEHLVSRFKLHRRTRELFECDAGTFMRSYCFDAQDRIHGVDIILKAPQKREIGNYGLSMHYDFATGVTSALLFGTDVVVCRDEATESPQPTAVLEGHGNLAEPLDLSGSELVKWRFSNIKSFKNKHHQRARPAILSSVRRNADRLRHPLALPAILLEDHIDRTRDFCETGPVADQTWEIMNSLGMRGDDYNAEHLFWVDAMSVKLSLTEEGKEKRFNAARLTARMDRHVLRILHSQKSPKWNRDCSQFLIDLAGDLNSRPLPTAPAGIDATSSVSHPASWGSAGAARTGVFTGRTNEEILESLEYNVQVSRSVLNLLSAMRENMTLQLDVCASITGLSSNAFSARIAWDTSRDSTSMKILAVITALFLPGTFAATFMSMGFWNWRWDPSDADHEQRGVASSYLYVYFAVAAPLTIITLLGWALWWLSEMVTKEDEYSDTQTGTPGDATGIERLVATFVKRRRKRREAHAPAAEGGSKPPDALQSRKNGGLRQRLWLVSRGKSSLSSHLGAGDREEAGHVGHKAAPEDV